MQKPLVNAAALILVGLVLAGCSTGAERLVVEPGVPQSSPLPPLPADLKDPCKDPGVREGEPVIVELARNRAWGKCGNSKHMGAVDMYEGARRATTPAPSWSDRRATMPR
jgi:hypothetical protein